MAGHRLVNDTGADVDAQLAAYLADLAARLRGPRRRRDAILAELRDGLHHATEAHIAAGLTPAQAAAAAITQFGDPQAVADAFAGELATAYARRTIAWYIVTGPLVGIWWLLLLQPHPWRTGLIALLAAIPVLPLIALAIATAAGTFATTGRLMRWLPETGPRPRPGRHHRHRHAVCHRRPHHDHRVRGVRSPSAPLSGHRRRRQPDPHRLQHHRDPHGDPDAATEPSAVKTSAYVAEQPRPVPVDSTTTHDHDHARR